MINDNALISFKLIQGIGNRDFELNVTRYNNVQNPTEPRDFWANDPVQIRLQNESFMTNYWYSIRRGEFRVVPPNVKVVENEKFIHAHVEFNGLSLFYHEYAIWTSNKEYVNAFTEGEYEDYFHNKLKFDDLLVAFRIYEKIDYFGSLMNKSDSKFEFSTRTFSNELHGIKIILTQIWGDNFNQRVLKKLDKDSDFIYKILVLIDKSWERFLKTNTVFSPDGLDISGVLKSDEIIETITEQEIDKIDWETYFDFDYGSLFTS